MRPSQVCHQKLRLILRQLMQLQALYPRHLLPRSNPRNSYLKHCHNKTANHPRHLLHPRELKQANLPDAVKRNLRKQWGKQVQKLIRLKRAQSRLNTISDVLTNFRGIRNLAIITGQKKKKNHIIEMKAHDGELHNDRDGIADFFAKCYEDLYSSTRSGDKSAVYTVLEYKSS